jgi:hypothetical protein
MRNTYKILFGKPEGNRPLRRPGLRRVYNIEMDLTGTERECGLD